MTEAKKRGRKPAKKVEKPVETAVGSDQIGLEPEEIQDIEDSIPNRPLFDIPAAAYQLGKRASTIRLWKENGRIKFEKIVGSIRIPRSEIVRIRIEGRLVAKNKDA